MSRLASGHGVKRDNCTTSHFYILFMYSFSESNIYILPDPDMENGGFRDLLGIEKVRKC